MDKESMLQRINSNLQRSAAQLTGFGLLFDELIREWEELNKKNEELQKEVDELKSKAQG